jgi:hypothetical protein
MSLTILRLSKDEAVYAWDVLAPVIQESLDYSQGELTTDDARTLAGKGFMQVWTAVEDDEVVGVMLTELVQYPRYKSVRVVTFSARLFADWREYEPLLEQYARELGADRVEAFVRPGLTRMLATLGGYTKAYDVIVKSVIKEIH